MQPANNILIPPRKCSNGSKTFFLCISRLHCATQLGIPRSDELACLVTCISQTASVVVALLDTEDLPRDQILICQAWPAVFHLLTAKHRKTSVSSQQDGCGWKPVSPFRHVRVTGPVVPRRRSVRASPGPFAHRQGRTWLAQGLPAEGMRE